MRTSKAITPDYNDGIDRKTLKVLKERFLNVNNGRLKRAIDALNDRQRSAFEALSMLFHLNHPILPGYVSHKTPCGISGFTPEKRHVRCAQTICRGFQYRRKPNADPKIHSIFLMGSCGTVAHSGSSDMDIWICHSSTLSDAEEKELRTKCDRISAWAAELDIEMYFFLIDADKFRDGQRDELSGEDCGSSQHYLLLDEFYRTGLLISGRYPLWWLIPVYNEDEYNEFAETLLGKRFIRETDVVDLGALAQIPAGEFIGAGMWQLYKGIDSPYKSVLKIALTEAYARDYPDVSTLALDFKKAVYEGQLDLDELDPYVMIYRRLERYLKELDDIPRLELIRHCFYFKANEPLSKKSAKSTKHWRYLVMEKLVTEWGWDLSYLQQIDNRNSWSIQRVQRERKSLVYELNHCYRFLSSFARKHQEDDISINQRDMHVLGRKLYAAFERKAGKIELINPNITTQLYQEQLSFIYVENEDTLYQESWSVYAGYVKIDSVEEPPIKRGRSLIELLAWCYFNKIFDRDTRFFIDAEDTDLNENELQQIISVLRQQFPDRIRPANPHSFEDTAFTTHVTLFLNVGFDPLRTLSQQGIHRLSNKKDALSYSAMNHNLAQTIDRIVVNSWGEIIVGRYDRKGAVMSCVSDFLRLSPPNSAYPPPDLEIHCFCQTRLGAIVERIEELFQDIRHCFHNDLMSRRSRYLIEIEKAYYVLQYEANTPTVKHLSNFTRLLEHLSAPQEDYSAIVLDRNTLQDSIIQTMTKTAEADRVQVFYRVVDQTAEIYVNDELGSVFFYTQPFHNELSLIVPLDTFLKATMQRINSENAFMDSGPVGPPMFYELIDNGLNKAPRAERKKPSQQPNPHHYFDVQAIGEQDSDGNVFYTIYCNHQEFSELEYGKDLYREVAQHIVQEMRSKNELYPCYLSDMDFSSNIYGNASDRPLLQTSQYLRWKHKIETALNQALRD